MRVVPIFLNFAHIKRHDYHIYYVYSCRKCFNNVLTDYAGPPDGFHKYNYNPSIIQWQK